MAQKETAQDLNVLRAFFLLLLYITKREIEKKRRGQKEQISIKLPANAYLCGTSCFSLLWLCMNIFFQLNECVVFNTTFANEDCSVFD